MEHRWTLTVQNGAGQPDAGTLADGQAMTLISGVDDFPKGADRDRASALVLELPDPREDGATFRLRVDLHPDDELIFFRRNRILLDITGKNRGMLHAYFLGWSRAGIVGRQKWVMMAQVNDKGELFVGMLDADGRAD